MNKAVLHVTGTPRPKQSARFVNGRVVSVVAARKLLKLWTAMIDAEGRKWLRSDGRTMTEAVRCDIDFYFATPRRERWGCLHTHVPDKENLEKAVLDALEKSKVIANDSRVATGLVSKWWAERAGAVIVLSEVGPHYLQDGVYDPDDIGAAKIDTRSVEA